jgi:hypothetical protein
MYYLFDFTGLMIKKYGELRKSFNDPELGGR